VASSVAGPVPPWKTIVVRIVETGAASCSPFASLLISIVANGHDEADLDDEDDYNDDDDSRRVGGGAIVIGLAL
jgi:hypothetical protein